MNGLALVILRTPLTDQVLLLRRDASANEVGASAGTPQQTGWVLRRDAIANEVGASAKTPQRTGWVLRRRLLSERGELRRDASANGVGASARWLSERVGASAETPQRTGWVRVVGKQAQGLHFGLSEQVRVARGGGVARPAFLTHRTPRASS